MFRSLALVAVSVAVVSTSTQALAGQVRLLGQTRLAYAENDLDAINPPGGCFLAGILGFTKLKVRVTQGAGEIEHIAVKYGNGDFDFLQVREHFRRGQETRWVDLQGNNRRCVAKIYVIGDTDNGAMNRAMVSVFGYKP